MRITAARSIDSVICWKWGTKPGYRSTFGPETVNRLRRMVARHYPHPHRFICVTDDAQGLDPDVEIIPDFRDFANLPSQHGERNPSCYRRLRMFHPDAAQWFGQRFVSLDLDIVITANLEALWHRPDDFAIYGDTNPTTYYNGSMVLLTAGARPKLWDEFDPKTSPKLARNAGFFGSDQAWISYCLGPDEKKFTKADGVYSYRNEIAKTRDRALPANARLVVFHGRIDPWHEEARRLQWVRENYPQ